MWVHSSDLNNQINLHLSGSLIKNMFQWYNRFHFIDMTKKYLNYFSSLHSRSLFNPYSIRKKRKRIKFDVRWYQIKMEENMTLSLNFICKSRTREENEKCRRIENSFENDIIGNLEIDLNIHFCSVFFFRARSISPRPASFQQKVFA